MWKIRAGATETAKTGTGAIYIEGVLRAPKAPWHPPRRCPAPRRPVNWGLGKSVSARFPRLVTLLVACAVPGRPKYWCLCARFGNMVAGGCDLVIGDRFAGSRWGICFSLVSSRSASACSGSQRVLGSRRIPHGPTQRETSRPLGWQVRRLDAHRQPSGRPDRHNGMEGTLCPDGSLSIRWIVSSLGIIPSQMNCGERKMLRIGHERTQFSSTQAVSEKAL